MTFRYYAGAALGLGLLTAALTMTTAGHAVAQGAVKPLQTLIINSTDAPVPVSITGPVLAVQPSWPGTPYASTSVLHREDDDNGPPCSDIFVGEPGKALLVNAVTGYLVPLVPDPSNRWVMPTLVLTAPGWSERQEREMVIPMHLGTTADGVQSYSGGLDLRGFPVAKLQACISYPYRLVVSFTGFVVPQS